MSITPPTEIRLADGSVLVTLHDGVFSPPADILVDPASDEATAALRAAYPDGLTINVHAFLLRRDDALVLIDGGCGAAYGPTLGRVEATLASIGVRPADISAVLVTHPHGDHVSGLFDDFGEALRYTQAKVFCPAIDIAHFSEVMEGENPNRAAARKFFAAAGDRMHPYGPGEVLPGVEAISMPGHTPGMSGFLIGGEVLIWADVMHLMDRQPQNPDIATVFDEDRALAAATRREAMAMAAEKGWIVGGMHLPVPGLARVSLDGGGFRMELVGG